MPLCIITTFTINPLRLSHNSKYSCCCCCCYYEINITEKKQPNFLLLWETIPLGRNNSSSGGQQVSSQGKIYSTMKKTVTYIFSTLSTQADRRKFYRNSIWVIVQGTSVQTHTCMNGQLPLKCSYTVAWPKLSINIVPFFGCWWRKG